GEFEARGAVEREAADPDDVGPLGPQDLSRAGAPHGAEVGERGTVAARAEVGVDEAYADRENPLEGIVPAFIAAAVGEQDLQHGRPGGEALLFFLFFREYFLALLGRGFDSLVLVLVVPASRRVLGQQALLLQLLAADAVAGPRSGLEPLRRDLHAAL